MSDGVTVYTIVIDHETDAPKTQTIADAVANIPMLQGEVNVMSDMTITNSAPNLTIDDN